ncbi:hypothetical protein [Bosea sp. (in: a-proteobacteria)]|uniref:hypothetical protein n=1 Tax=Bosea sp. (in: a-proteobacteria) TaxID=1871050 RepID=UPI002638B902|nr:hypothetical protein [Bosea sp. (in: a-proteobacteria)]MCO5093408.1 hypothetical protein [Bosea sp. (in: a-proteobacteria)]
MRYTDELDTLRTARDRLRRRIAERLAMEADAPLSEHWLTAADATIEAWEREGEEAQDQRAFRPLGPLQALLADHAALVERIADALDRRLS